MRAAVAENQRRRILVATAQAVEQRGCPWPRVSDVVRLAGVSRTTLYQHFDGLDDCLLAAHAMAADRLWKTVSAASAEADRVDGAQERRRAALAAALDLFAADPLLAILLGPRVAFAVPAIAAARARLVARLATLLADGRGRRDTPSPHHRHLVEAALWLVCERVAGGQPDRLPKMGDELAILLAL